MGTGAARRRAGLGVGREGTGCTVVGTDGVAMRRAGSAAMGRCLLPLDSLDWAKQLVRNENKHQGYRFLLLTASSRQRKTPNKYN